MAIKIKNGERRKTKLYYLFLARFQPLGFASVFCTETFCIPNCIRIFSNIISCENI